MALASLGLGTPVASLGLDKPLASLDLGTPLASLDLGTPLACPCVQAWVEEVRAIAPTTKAVRRRAASELPEISKLVELAKQVSGRGLLFFFYNKSV